MDVEAGGLITGQFPNMEPGMLEELSKEISMVETKRAIMNMSSYKTPGLNGFQALFFKRTWHIVGDAVHAFAKKMMEGGEVPKEAVDPLLY